MENLDSNLFKAFVHAATDLNFTAAARRAGMTQSGISQHIAKLEEQMGVSLFERVNKKVALTRPGRLLLAYIENQKDTLAKLREAIHSETQVLAGPVRYAMPQSCLFTPHFPLLLKDRREFPGVTLSVELCPNEVVFERLLSQQIDFGFVTRETPNPAVSHEAFAREEYILVGSSKLKAPSPDPDELRGIPFVDYPGMNVLFDIWRRQTFPKAKQLGYESLNIVGSINSLHGAVTMLVEQVGWTVMPSHCAEPFLSQKHLRSLSMSRGKVTSEIFIVTLREQQLPARVNRVVETFRGMKKK